MAGNVGRIFEERPQGWGFRGDPYLWEELEQHFSKIYLPYSVEEFIIEFHRLFEEFTGDKLESTDYIHVPRYSHGGMSSGMISQEFWFETALPMLIKRLQNQNL